MTRRPHPVLMLVVGMAAQIVATIAASSAVFLIPYFHLHGGLTLVEAGYLAACPMVGTMLTLVAWGSIADHRGERLSLSVGIGLSALASLGAALFDTSHIALGLFWFFAGVGAASSHVASGRLVVGWFRAERRGLAMGWRQTALPMGIGLTAVLAPNLVETIGLAQTQLVIAALCAVVTLAVALLVTDPPRPPRHEAPPADLANPYRGSRTLVRIHAASALLIVPQLTIWTFMLVWLIEGRGWSTFAASLLAAGSQFAGVVSRIAAGWWSDRVGSRLGPMRTIAVAAALTMVAFGLTESTVWGYVFLLVAAGVTVADNGLAATAVAEVGGPFWAGRALGVQHTGQYVVSMFIPPVVGALITVTDYGPAFVLVALAAALAVPVIPRRSVANIPA